MTLDLKRRAEEGIEKCRVGNWKEGMDDPRLGRRAGPRRCRATRSLLLLSGLWHCPSRQEVPRGVEALPACHQDAGLRARQLHESSAGLSADPQPRKGAPGRPQRAVARCRPCRAASRLAGVGYPEKSADPLSVPGQPAQRDAGQVSAEAQEGVTARPASSADAKEPQRLVGDERRHVGQPRHVGELEQWPLPAVGLPT